jgi:hypothetical protein
MRRPKNLRKNTKTKPFASCQELPIHPTSQVTIEGVQVRALIDTGSMKPHFHAALLMCQKLLEVS